MIEDLKPGKIYEAIVKLIADAEPIAKGKKTEGFYKYRGIEDIYNSVNPLMAKHKIFNTFETEERRERQYKTASGAEWMNVAVKVRFKFYADDGSFVEIALWGEGADSGDKGSGKAYSQAHKYAICMLLCWPYEGDHKEAPEAIAADATKQQHKELSMSETVKSFPVALKDKLKSAGYDTLAKAFKAYQDQHGDLDALSQLCDEKMRKK